MTSSHCPLLRRVVTLSFWVSLLCAPAAVHAHGLFGHIHVTGWAIENLPPGELRTMFEDPEVFKAALHGAMLPDTGYALDRPAAREYGEWAHWEPFIESFVERVRTLYGPDYDTKEEQMLVAFLMGCAAHGMQDEIFDSTFLYEVEQRDGHGQDSTDPGTDGFLVLDGYFRLLPGNYLPLDELLPLFSTRPAEITAELIQNQVNTVRNAYVNDTLGPMFAAGYGRRARLQIPWAAANYMDPGITGSLASEVEPTMRYLQSLWERLHDRFDERDLIIHGWPDAPRRLREADHQSVASWVTVVLGEAVRSNTASGRLVDEDGESQPIELRYTRWGGYDSSRILRFVPSQDLIPGEHYTVIIEPGAELIDGTRTTAAHEYMFQVACAAADDPRCPPLTIEDDPVIELGATPTATATASASATATIPSTATASPTATPPATATTTPSAIPSPTLTAAPSATRTPTTMPTLTASPSSSPTSGHTPRSYSDDGCQLQTSSSAGLAWLGMAPLIGLRRRRR